MGPLDEGGYGKPSQRNQCQQSDAERRCIVAITNTFACANEPFA